MHKFLRCAVVVAVSAAGLVGSTSMARAGNCKYPVENKSQTPIIVAMDTDREVQMIPPGGRVIFQEANIGDDPTFHVYAVNPDGSRGPQLYADSFNTLRLFHAPGGRDLTWTGSKLED